MYISVRPRVNLSALILRDEGRREGRGGKVERGGEVCYRSKLIVNSSGPDSDRLSYSRSLDIHHHNDFILSCDLNSPNYIIYHGYILVLSIVWCRCQYKDEYIFVSLYHNETPPHTPPPSSPSLSFQQLTPFPLLFIPPFPAGHADLELNFHHPHL